MVSGETEPVSERLRVREIDDECRRLVRIIRQGSGSVVAWRMAQMVLVSAQGMAAPAIATVAFTRQDRVRDVIRNFNADGFASLYPNYKGDRPPKFTLAQRRQIKKMARGVRRDALAGFRLGSLCQVGLGGWGEVGEAVFEPPAGAVDGDDLAVVQEAVQDGGGEDFVGEDLAPFAEGLVAGDDD